MCDACAGVRRMACECMLSSRSLVTATPHPPPPPTIFGISMWYLLCTPPTAILSVTHKFHRFLAHWMPISPNRSIPSCMNKPSSCTCASVSYHAMIRSCCWTIWWNLCWQSVQKLPPKSVSFSLISHMNINQSVYSILHQFHVQSANTQSIQNLQNIIDYSCA